MEIAAGDVADLAAGATLLGSGGGGDTATGAILVRRALEEHGPVRLVRAADLDPAAWVIPVAAIGATTVMLERLPGADEFVAAVRGLERRLGVRAAAVHGLETGGVNALFPVAVAAWLGLPLVDADGMGRAFPRLDQTLLSVAGVPASPAVFVDPSGNELVVGTADDAMVEHLARAALPALGGWAASAMYPMRAADSARAALGGSFSGARRLGRLLARARAMRGGDRAGILALGGARVLFAGDVLEVRQRGRGSLGTATIAHHRDRGRTLRVEMADEYLLALDDGEAVACVPDLICVLDSRSWLPISAERLAVGQHVDLLGMPAPARWREPAAVERAGPAAFGLDMPAPPAAPSASAAPGLPAEPGLPAGSSPPVVPGRPAVPGLPSAPSVPVAPSPPAMPDPSVVPGLSGVPGAPDRPAVSDLSATPGVPVERARFR